MQTRFSNGPGAADQVILGEDSPAAYNSKLTQVLNDAVAGRSPVNESLRSVSELLSHLNFNSSNKSGINDTVMDHKSRSRVNFSFASGASGSGAGPTQAEFIAEFRQIVNTILLPSFSDSSIDGRPMANPSLLEKLDIAFYDYNKRR